MTKRDTSEKDHNKKVICLHIIIGVNNFRIVMRWLDTVIWCFVYIAFSHLCHVGQNSHNLCVPLNWFSLSSSEPTANRIIYRIALSRPINRHEENSGKYTRDLVFIHIDSIFWKLATVKWLNNWLFAEPFASFSWIVFIDHISSIVYWVNSWANSFFWCLRPSYIQTILDLIH